MRKVYEFFKQGISEFSQDDCMSSGAAIAYYTIFSLPPLLVIVFLIAQWFGVSHEKIDQVVRKQLGMPLPQQSQGGESSESSSDSSGKPAEKADGSSEPESGGMLQGVAGRAESTKMAESLGLISQIVGIVLLIFSATGVFAQLQFALNRAWEVEPDPEQGGVVSFLFKRFLSLGIIVVMGFLLLVSFVLTTLIDELTTYLQGGSPTQLVTIVGMILNNLAAFLLALLLFAAMFKILPDAKMRWKDVWIGAGITALLFVVGKALIAWYIQNSDLGSSWGSAAASMIGLLVWVYYSSLIILLGAEFTQVWANRFGSGIEPADGAVRKVEEKRHVRDSAA